MEPTFQKLQRAMINIRGFSELRYNGHNQRVSKTMWTVEVLRLEEIMGITIHGKNWEMFLWNYCQFYAFMKSFDKELSLYWLRINQDTIHQLSGPMRTSLAVSPMIPGISKVGQSFLTMEPHFFIFWRQTAWTSVFFDKSYSSCPIEDRPGANQWMNGWCDGILQILTMVHFVKESLAPALMMSPLLSGHSSQWWQDKALVPGGALLKSQPFFLT